MSQPWVVEDVSVQILIGFLISVGIAVILILISHLAGFVFIRLLCTIVPRFREHYVRVLGSPDTGYLVYCTREDCSFRYRVYTQSEVDFLTSAVHKRNGEVEIKKSLPSVNLDNR